MKKLLSVFILLFGLTQVYGVGAPSTPTGFNSPDATDSSITLNWNSSAWATGYRVYFIPEGGLAYVLVKDISGVSNTTTDITEIPNHFGTPISLNPATQYHFTVTAYNSADDSDYATSIWSKTTHTWGGELLNCLNGATSTPPTRTELDAITSFECRDKNLITMVPVEDLSQHITDLDLFNNDLVGTIPGWITTRTNLTSLNLADNNLTGSIPTEIGELIKLTDLSLKSNELTGIIPTEIGNLIKLKYIHMEGNQLTGTIPAEIGELKLLTTLLLGNNQLTGSIPDEIGELIELTYFRVYDNQLSGEIPESIVNLDNITMNNFAFRLDSNCNLFSDNDDTKIFIDIYHPSSTSSSGYNFILDTNSHDCTIANPAANPAVIMYLLN